MDAEAPMLNATGGEDEKVREERRRLKKRNQHTFIFFALSLQLGENWGFLQNKRNNVF